MNTIKTRKMTVGYSTDGKYSRLQSGEIKPMIRLANRFLLRSKFQVGDKVDVEYSEGLIKIRKILNMYDYNSDKC